jgi:predicted RNase H-related nuclease YkuK (DUF458 family)
MSALDSHPWQNLSGDHIADIRKAVKDILDGSEYSLHIGTDTKPHMDSTTLITTICLREEGKGALVFIQRRKLEPFVSVLDRLLHEAVISLEVAEEVKGFTNMVPTIHADVNPNEQNLSNRVADAIMGMIKGMGYPVLIKPDAWAADIADMYTR